MVIRAFTRRCPICGHHPVFTGWADLTPECPTCGMVYEREPGFFVGNVGINTILSFGVAFVVIAIAVAITIPHVPALPIAIAVMVIGVVAPIVFHPISKLLWLVVDLIIKPLEPKEAPKAERKIDVTAANAK